MSDWGRWISYERVQRWLVGRRIVEVRNLHLQEPFDADASVLDADPAFAEIELVLDDGTVLRLEDPVEVAVVGAGLGDERVA